MTEIELHNLRKYLKAPTIEQVSSFIKELGVSDVQFERFYEMKIGTMKKLRSGYRNLPRKFWHFIYEKKVPTYGLSTNNEYKPKVRKLVHSIPNKQSVVDVNRLETLK